MKYLKISTAAIAFALIVFFGCTRSTLTTDQNGTSLSNTTGASTTSTSFTSTLGMLTALCNGSSPTSIDVLVCGAATGAPAGFVLQWMLKSDYDTYGWPAGATGPASFCQAVFAVLPGCTTHLIPPSGCVSVNIGANPYNTCGVSSTCSGPLVCNTAYVFRTYALADPASGADKSVFSNTIICSTAPCASAGCTYTMGFWKTHGPTGCASGKNTNAWPVSSLQLGTVSYTNLQLCSIFQTPVAGNGLISLAHQLIAAKLNIANGASGSSINQTISDADALIGGLVVPPAGNGWLAPSATSALITALTNFNEGLTGPGHCD